MLSSSKICQLRVVKIRHNHVVRIFFAILLIFSTLTLVWIHLQDQMMFSQGIDGEMINKYKNANSELKTLNYFENRMKERQQLLKRGCKKYSKHGIGTFLSRPEDVFYSPPYNISICIIQKVACQYWWKFLVVLQKNNSVTAKRIPYRLNNLTDQMKSKWEQSYKVLFTREPYARLLAGYVDKFLSPNPYFWGVGKVIIKRFRKNATNRSLEYGHDVTFPEFVKYVLQMQDMSDPHFVPIHKHCAICLLRYDCIGKIETIKQDTIFIIRAINASSLASISQFVNSDHILNEIRVNAKQLFFHRKPILQKCMKMHEALRRLWKRWQIRGFISIGQNFSISQEESETISFYEFLSFIFKAFQRSTKSARRFTRYQFKKEYFQSLPFSDKLSLTELFRPEFEMFGYEPEPLFVFPDKSK